MAFKDRMQTVANTLLTNYGESITCQRVAEGAYDPANLSVAAGTITNYTGVGLPTDYRADEIDGVNVQLDDTLVIFYSATEPFVGDTFTFNDITYRAIRVERIRAQGADVFYKVQVRK